MYTATYFIVSTLKLLRNEAYAPICDASLASL